MFLSWWHYLAGRRRVRRKLRYGARLEQLEDRVVPATATKAFLDVGPGITKMSAARSTTPRDIGTDGLSDSAVGGIHSAVNTTSTPRPLLLPAAPSIAVNPTSLDLGTTVGMAGTAKTYTVSGIGLNAPLVITAPTGVEISSDGGMSYHAMLTLTPSAGIVPNTTIFARVTAGAFLNVIEGKITNISTGATELDVSVTSTTGIGNFIGVSPASLDLGFTFSPPFSPEPGTARTYTIFGDNLTGPVTITAPTGVEVSSDNGMSYHASLTLVPTAGILASTPINVRIASMAPLAGAFTAQITNTGAGFTEQDVIVTGAVLGDAPPTIVASPLSLDLGVTPPATAGAAKTYIVSASNLTAPLLITAPARVEISADGGATYHSTLTLTPTDAIVPATTINARISADAFPGILNGKITNYSTAATEQDVTVTGTVADVNPAFTVSLVSLDLGITIPGRTGTAETYRIFGGELTAPVIITAPTGVEASADGGASFHSTLTLIPTQGTLPTTNIQVRIGADAAPGAITGRITNTSSGVTEQDITLFGTVTIPSPSIMVSAASLDLGTTIAGAAGNPHTYTIFGNTLTGAITITAPAGVEISSDNGASYHTTLTLTPTGGFVDSTTITVRIAGGAPQGAIDAKITNTSSGVTEQDVSVTGTVQGSPAITVSAASLDLGTVTPGAPSTGARYTISGDNLTAPITIAAPPGVEISIDNGASYHAALTLLPTSGMVTNTTISARISAAVTPGAVAGTITNASTGATTQNIAVTGAVSNPVNPTIRVSVASLDLGVTVPGTASPPMTYTVSGSGLMAPITIAAPTGVELSSDGGITYHTTLTLNLIAGTVPATTINARISATGETGALSGRITDTSTGATEQDVSVTGTLVAVLISFISPSVTSLDLGTTTQGAVGAAKSYTVFGANLTTAVTIAAPTGVEVSSDGGASYHTTLTLTPGSGVVQTTTINARISAAATPGAVTGEIVNSSTGATEQDVRVTSTVNVPTVPTIAVSPTSLDLGTTTQGTIGSSKTYTISGLLLNAPLIITAPTGAEVSSDNGASYHTTLTLTPTAGIVASTTITVRLIESSTEGVVFGRITNTSAGAAEQDVTVTSTVVAPIPTITVSSDSLDLGTTAAATAGTAKNYTVSGTNLTAPINIVAPAGIEVSSDSGASYHNSLIMTPTSGTVPNTTISVRIIATAVQGIFSGDITNVSEGATERDVSATGTVVVGDQTLSYHQHDFTVNLPPAAAASFTIAGKAFFLQRDLGLSLPASPQNLSSISAKWFQGNGNSFGNPWYFIKPDGQLYAWDGTSSASGSALVATLDPVYYVYPDLLANPSHQTFDFVLRQRLGLTFTGNFSQDYGSRNEKWLRGIVNANGNPWYFINPAGHLYAWDGTANQATGTLLAALDPLYWAQPSRVFDAKPDEATGVIVHNAFQVTTTKDFAGNVTVELNIASTAASHQTFTLSWVSNPPVLTVTPSGNQTTKQGTPISLTLAASDADADTVKLSPVGGHLGFVLHQSLGLRLQGSLFLNYGGQNEEWLEGNSNNWYFVKPDGSLWKWDGTVNQATGTQVTALDPVYYYHPELLYNPPGGDLAFALFQRLRLTSTGNVSLNYGGQNEKWLLGNDGWYFIKPDGTLWKWDGTAHRATGTLYVTLNTDYYSNIQRFYEVNENEVTVDITSNTLTITPAAGFIGQFWVLVKAESATQSVFNRFSLTVTA